MPLLAWLALGLGPELVQAAASSGAAPGGGRDAHWAAAQLATGSGAVFGAANTSELCNYALLGYERQQNKATELLYAVNSTHARSLGTVYAEVGAGRLSGREFVFGVDYTPQQIADAQRLCAQITDEQLLSWLVRASGREYVEQQLRMEPKEPKEPKEPEDTHKEL